MVNFATGTLLVATLLTLLGVVSAGVPTPDISLGVNVGHDTQTGSMGGVVPTAKWQSEVISVAGMDVQGGLDVVVTDVSTPMAPSANLWGKLRKIIPGVGMITVRGDMDPNSRDVADLNIQLNAFDTGIQVVGSADLQYPGVTIDKIQLTKSIDTLGGTVSLNPKYDVGKNIPDVSVGYAMGDTSFKVDAEQRKLTVAHTFAGGNKVVPTVTAAGDFSLSYSRPLLEGGRLTTTWTPDDSVKVQWTDGGWDASVVAPLDGYFQTNNGIKVSMKRSVSIMEAGVIDFN